VADARGWDPDAVDGMLQEVEESRAILLPAAEQILQELAEEARASWEERTVFCATCITNLAGEAFETPNETRWSRRDCTEYQDELDWEMRTFPESATSSTYRACRPRCAGQLAPERTESTTSISGPRELWKDSYKLTRTDQETQADRRPEAAIGTRGSTQTSLLPSTCPREEWSTRSPYIDRRPPCRWLMSLERADLSGPGTAHRELDVCAPLHPTGAEDSVTWAWRDYTLAYPHASAELPTLAEPAHRWSGIQGSLCPVLFQVFPLG
jgi:hypothetical protein